jgi:sialate O-acetylesterase
MKIYISLIVLVFSSVLCFGQTKLPGFFSNNMVLQQDQQVSIWGEDKPGTKIKIKGSWGKDAQIVTGINGKWKTKLQTPKAGGPYELLVKGSKTITYQGVLIGEVWLCSGQSNMEMPMKGYNNQPIIGSNEAILGSTNDKIRFFNTPKSVSLTPLDDVKSEWKSANPTNTGSFSATAYFFARKMQSSLGVPIGIIQTAWGGSSVESWMDSVTLKEFPHAIIPTEKPKTPNTAPTILYKSMLHPYIGYTIKGALWYQGESNRVNAHQYHDLFSKMIASWRKQWDQGDFPFYFVQIAPFEPGKENSAFLREAQLKTMLTEKNVGMASTLDAGDKIIHPAQKEVVGNRLAYWALAKTYNITGISYSGPIYKQMKINENGRAIVSFDHAEMGLSTFGKPFSSFEIAGEDRIFYPAEAALVPNKVGDLMVWSEQVPKPVSVRYGFKSWVEASLFNIAGLPASSFRTDDWK